MVIVTALEVACRLGMKLNYHNMFLINLRYNRSIRPVEDRWPTLRQGERGGVDDDGHVEHHLEGEAGRPQETGLLVETPFQVLQRKIWK